MLLVFTYGYDKKIVFLGRQMEAENSTDCRQFCSSLGQHIGKCEFTKAGFQAVPVDYFATVTLALL